MITLIKATHVQIIITLTKNIHFSSQKVCKNLQQNRVMKSRILSINML